MRHTPHSGREREKERERWLSLSGISCTLCVPCINAYKMWNGSVVDTVAIKSDRCQVLLHLRDLCWLKSGGHWVQEKWSLPVFSCIENQPCSDTKRVEDSCFMRGLTVHYDLLLMRFCSTTHHIHLCHWHPLSGTLRQCLWHSIMYYTYSIHACSQQPPSILNECTIYDLCY